jgi:DNA-binding FadR family transcriptional regulator
VTIYRRPDPIPHKRKAEEPQSALQPLREHAEDLNQLAARRIFMAIAAKNWSQTGFLPKEDQLGDELGVSRTVVREAIKSLASKSIVETRRRRGTTILDYNFWNLIDRELIDWMSQSHLYPTLGNELFDALAITQPMLAAKAAERPKLAADLETLASRIGASSSSKRAELVLEFHLRIAQIANNPHVQILTANAIEGLRVHHWPKVEEFVSKRHAADYINAASAINAGNIEKSRNLLMGIFENAVLETA